MLHLHVSNRYEHLRSALLTYLAREVTHPLYAPQVIVPGSAMQRDVTLAGAQQFGIFANIRFDYLAQWLWRQIGLFVPVSTDSPFAAPVLTWRIMEALSHLPLLQDHPRLAAWLNQADDVMRWQFAQRTAVLFESYTTYRPQWLRSWRDGIVDGPANPSDTTLADQAWQAALWRHLEAQLQLPTRDPIQEAHGILSALTPEQALQRGLPATVHVFCLPAVAPLHLGLLQAIGRLTELHWYVINPCEAYWFDLLAPRTLTWLKARQRDQGRAAGHPLLLGWGRQTQSHLTLMLDQLIEPYTDDASFEPPSGDSLLMQLQRGILQLTPLQAASLVLSPDDDSLEVHSCHSLTRELEVLHDRLLGLIADQGLQPSEVLVVTPNLDAAAPLIEAVFGTVPAARRIPFTLTGQSRNQSQGTARALLSLLALAGSRVTVTEVFAVLQQEVISRRFGLDEADLAILHEWLRKAGFHWAFNAEHLQSLGLSPHAGHTLHDALERLFLGYALPDSVQTPFQQSLPAASVEGSLGLVLASLWRFTQLLQSLRRRLAVGLTAAQWRTSLNELIAACIAAQGDQLDELRELRATVQHLLAQIEASGTAQIITLAVLRTALESALQDGSRGASPQGRVTFASLSALRNLPYRVVCAIGLNGDSFPSSARAPEFDLLALDPRPGDRQRRLDDRNIFLDLLLSARERLYLSHTGRSVRDNSPLPPSSLIDELIDTVCQSTRLVSPEPDLKPDPSPASTPALTPALTPHSTPDAAQRVRARLVIEHPLQPFSLRAFQPASSGIDPRLQSFNTELAQALAERAGQPAAVASGALCTPGDQQTASLTAAPQPLLIDGPDTEADAGDSLGEAQDTDGADEVQTTGAPAFFNGPLPDPGPEWHRVSLEQLIRFFSHPCRYLLRERLRIPFEREAEALDDDEPFALTPLARHELALRLLPALLRGETAASLMPQARAGTEAPRGALGDRLLADEIDALARFADQIREASSPARLPSTLIDLTVALGNESWQIHGSLTDLHASGPVQWRYGKLASEDRLRSWITLLAAGAAGVSGMAPAACFVARNGRLRLRAPAQPDVHLADLLGLYRLGLTRPLHFFPRAAWDFVATGYKLAQARAVWEGRPGGQPGERTRDAYGIALRGLADPLDTEFIALARRVFDPLLEHVDEHP